MQRTENKPYQQTRWILLTITILLNLIAWLIWGRPPQDDSFYSLYLQRILLPLPIYFFFVLIEAGPLKLWWLRGQITLTVAWVFPLFKHYNLATNTITGLSVNLLLVYVVGALLAVYLDTEILPMLLDFWPTHWKSMDINAEQPE